MAFSPELFTFLAELRENNDRDWFARNKQRYETHVLEPTLDFIEAFRPHLEAISSQFVAGGIWHPETAATNRIRQAIADHPDEWRAATRDAGLALGGDSLKRAPKG